LQQCDLVRHAVGLDNLARLIDDGRHVDTNDVFCACLHGEPVLDISASARVRGVGYRAAEHAEDGCTASDIEDDLVLEQVAVLVDRVAVALGADLVFL
jgi:hypothetical protein